MTWFNWINSNYNTSGFICWNTLERVSNADDHISYEGDFVYGYDAIVENYNYITIYDGSEAN